MKTPMDSLGEIIAWALERLRCQRPLVHHITNLVTMNDVANATLAIGALPVMAHAAEEVAEMVSTANVLVLNLGTLTPTRVRTMLIAGRRANELGLPIVLDPVGAGATSLRTESARQLLSQLKVTIVRGNQAEASALADLEGQPKGVEALEDSDNAVEVAGSLARKYGLTTAITGQRDIVCHGQRIMAVDNGHPLLRSITGSGCMATALVAAFAAVEDDPLLAATAGLVCFGLAGELAAARAKGPGTFRAALLDQIYDLSRERILAGTKACYLMA